jgi:VWFA-related protein
MPLLVTWRHRGVRTLLAACCAALVSGVAAGASPQTTARESRDRHILMTVLDAKDTPVTDLTVADVVVREDGVAREISRVSRATAPMQIALLADDSQAAISMPSDLQQGLTSFVRHVIDDMPDSEIMLMTFGERPTTVVPFTTSAAVLTRATGQVFPRSGAGAYMLEAIQEASKALARKNATRPVIVAFLVEDGPEFSTASQQMVAQSLKSSGASLWTIVLQGRQASMTTEQRERAAVIGDIATASGGGLKTVIDKQGLVRAFDAIATLLASQVDVAYARPDRLVPPTKLEVSVKRPGLRVWAPRWTGTR